MTTDNLLSTIEADESDPRIQAALAELRALIAARYPEASFAIYRGEDPDGIRLAATVDVEELDEVMDVFLDRLVELQVEEGLPVSVVLDWPIERVRDQLRRKETPPADARLVVDELDPERRRPQTAPHRQARVVHADDQDI